MQARKNALAVLRRLAGSAAGQAPCAAAGMIPVFVASVRSGSGAQRTASAGALRDLAGRIENHAAIARAGGVEALVGLARDGDAAQREVATAALLVLAESEAMSARIVAAGGVDVLTACVQDGASGGDTKEEDVKVKQSLVLEAGRGGSDVLEGKVGVMQPLKDQQSEQEVETESVENTETLSSSLPSDDQRDGEADAAGVEEDAKKPSSPLPIDTVQQCVALIKGGEVVDDSDKTRAASKLFDLSSTNVSQAGVVAASGIPALIDLLLIGSKAQQTNAAGALMNLAKSAAVRPDILAAGGVQALVQSMGYDEAGTFATAALVNMAAYPPSHAVIVEANGIAHLVCILRGASSDALTLLAAMGLSVLAKARAAAKTIYSYGGASGLFLLARRGTAEQRTHALRALRRMTKAGVIDPAFLATGDGLTTASPTTQSEQTGCKRGSKAVDREEDVAKRIKTEVEHV